MAKITSVGFDELAKQFETVADHAGAIASEALYAGAGLMADKLRSSVENLSVDGTNRRHASNQVLDYEKEALQKGLMVEKFKTDVARGYKETAVTFKGRTDHRTKRYPDGMPIILLARAIIKGTPFRKANRFFPNTVNRNRAEVEQLMVKTAEEEMAKKLNRR